MNDWSETKRRLMGGVLAGGRSSRMGKCKASLKVPSGETLLCQISGALSSYCSQVFVSVPSSRRMDFAADYAIVPDTVDFRGPVNGVVNLLCEATRRELDAVLVVSVDLPRLRSEDLFPLVEAWRQDPAQLVVATGDGTVLEPLVGIYPASYLLPLRRLASGEDRSLSRWLHSIHAKNVRLSEAAIRSVNSPSEWSEFYE